MSIDAPPSGRSARMRSADQQKRQQYLRFPSASATETVRNG